MEPPKKRPCHGSVPTGQSPVSKNDKINAGDQTLKIRSGCSGVNSRAIASGFVRCVCTLTHSSPFVKQLGERSNPKLCSWCRNSPNSEPVVHSHPQLSSESITSKSLMAKHSSLGWFSAPQQSLQMVISRLWASAGLEPFGQFCFCFVSRNLRKCTEHFTVLTLKSWKWCRLKKGCWALISELLFMDR